MVFQLVRHVVVIDDILKIVFALYAIFIEPVVLQVQVEWHELVPVADCL